MIILKREGLPVKVCRLGEDSPLERELIRNGSVRRRPGSSYEVFSRESGREKGELAEAGDFVKVDRGGWPYPVRSGDFLAEHRLRDGEWIQIPRPLEAWEPGQPMSDAVLWALEHGRLRLDESDHERFFQARLWGADLSAPRDAVLVFYRIQRDPSGQILDLNFNFVVREEFLRTYQIAENEDTGSDIC